MDYEQIVDELIHGSETAFNKIYEIYGKRLYAFCLMYCKSRDDAEEVVEDTFVKLWQNRISLNATQSLQSLLFTISRNKLINLYRRRINSPEYAEYVDAISQSVSYGHMPDEKLEYDDFVLKLEQSLNELPLTQQKVIRMSKIDGMKNKEIAQTLNLSEQTVKNQLSTGLKMLHSKIGIMVFLLFLVNQKYLWS